MYPKRHGKRHKRVAVYRKAFTQVLVLDGLKHSQRLKMRNEREVWISMFYFILALKSNNKNRQRLEIDRQQNI